MEDRTMNRKFKNLLLLGIFLVIMFATTFTGAFGHKYEWPQMDKEDAMFHGLIFDEPSNVSNLMVTRSIENDPHSPMVRYDVEFTYEGNNSNMRLLGVPIRHVFFPKGVDVHRSNATLKGEYDKLNQHLFEKLKTRDLLNKQGISSLKASSQIRIPLTNEVSEYAFSVYEEPLPMYSRNYEKLADLSVFVTNARMDRFTDNNLVNKGSKVKAQTKSDIQAGFYENYLERIHEKKINSIALRKNIFTAVFIVSLLAALVLIVLDKDKLFTLAMVLMMLMIPSFYPVMDVGVSTQAMLLLYPVLAFVAAVFTKLMAYDRIKIGTKDLKQSLGFTIIFFIANVLLFILPRAF